MRFRTSDELIPSLVAELRPVRPLAGPTHRALRWAAGGAVFVFAGAAALGLRGDLASQLRNPHYLRESAALALTIALSARSAFELGIPNLARDVRWPLAAIAVLLTWCVQVALAVAPLPELPLVLARFWRSGLACVHRTTWLALAPALGISWMLRRGAPLERSAAGLFAALAAAALATLGTQFICVNDEPWHALVWHVAPVILAGLAGSALGTRLARRTS
ncbi:MAG TPA: NrsF family protein [Polyangiales bacterium]|nr:NrsF family protein [Polyangiales bacterium]